MIGGSLTAQSSSAVAVNRWQRARIGTMRQADGKKWTTNRQLSGGVAALRRLLTLPRLFMVKRIERIALDPDATKTVSTHEAVQPVQELLPGDGSDEAIQAELNRRTAVFHASKQGWRGTRYDLLVEGVFEDRGSLNRRRMLRLLPAVTALVEDAWQACKPQMGRIILSSYLNYHLSCYRYIQEKEMPGCLTVDLFDAWESGMDDWLGDNEGSLKQVAKRELHFHLFRDSM